MLLQRSLSLRRYWEKKKKKKKKETNISATIITCWIKQMSKQRKQTDFLAEPPLRIVALKIDTWQGEAREGTIVHGISDKKRTQSHPCISRYRCCLSARFPAWQWNARDRIWLRRKIYRANASAHNAARASEAAKSFSRWKAISCCLTPGNDSRAPCVVFHRAWLLKMYIL